MSRLRVIFMGTPEFAVPSLKKIQEEHEIVAVVTQPDRRSGRGQRYSFSPVKKAALQYGLPVWQGEGLATEAFQARLAEAAPEAVLVVAFGQKIPESLLKTTRYGWINVHPSLLPKYRGAAPINAAILNGDDRSGVTTMYLSPEWDAGDLILQVEDGIDPRDTAGTLEARLSLLGADLLAETLQRLEAGTAPRTVQNEAAVSWAPKLTKEGAYLDFERSAQELDRQVRGMNPRPGAHTLIKGEMVKIWQTLPGSEKGRPGQILAVTENGLEVGCGKGSLLLQQVQRPNGKVVSGQDLFNGLRLRLGEGLN